MKKILTILLSAAVMLTMMSCDIEASRPLTAKVTVELKDIPSNVKAVALYCNLNEWKADNVNGSDTYIAEVQSGVATWELKNYTLATPLKFQFTPLPSKDTKMGDDWWSYALSGSSTYANQENNLYCNFITLGKSKPCKITVSKETFTATGGKWKPFPIYGIDSSRQWNEGYTKCFTCE